MGKIYKNYGLWVEKESGRKGGKRRKKIDLSSALLTLREEINNVICLQKLCDSL